MNENELREKILLNLLVNKFKDEEVTAESVKTVEKEFYRIIGELATEKKTKGLSAREIAKLGLP